METDSPNPQKLYSKNSFILESDLNEDNSSANATNENYNTIYPLNMKKEIITNGNFNADPYSFAQEIKDANDEHLIFVVHGIGQDEKKLKSTLQKIKTSILTIYGKKSKLFEKQIHIRIIDWKTMLLEKEQKTFNDLVDYNNETKYPKMFIQQVPLDVLHYLSIRNKYNILNDIISQMNSYYNLVIKHRPLFKGNVSIVGHSVGSVMLYDILTNMSKNKFQNKKSFSLGDMQHNMSSQEDAFAVISKLDRSKRKDNLKEYLNKKVSEFKILEEIVIDDCSGNSSDAPTIDLQPSPKKNCIIYSLDPNLTPLKFYVENLFLMGSPLSLFLSVEHGINYHLQEMDIVKDFHNIIHPMDPVAYRIEPLIMDYTKFSSSFVLPHWENDGIHNFLFDYFMKFFFCDKGKVNDEIDTTSKRKIERKRYDFMVQEYPTERAVNVIGFLFSHMAYWNNPDVFYFVIKMIHGHGYQPPITKN